MSDAQSYNGWTNYPTWRVFDFLTSDPDSGGYYRSLAMEVIDTLDDIRENWSDCLSDKQIATYALADWLRDDIRCGEPEEISGSLWSDLLGASLDSVNWSEIAEALVADQLTS